MQDPSKVRTTHCTVFASPIGNLVIYTDNNNLLRLEITDQPINTSLNAQKESLPIANTVIAALNDYFAAGSPLPRIPTAPLGTTFQLSVWAALAKIPPGKTMTYGELAQQLGTSPRAVGAACRSNPIPIIIPCHRVTAQHHLGGYMGATRGQALKNKTFLLQKEGAL